MLEGGRAALGGPKGERTPLTIGRAVFDALARRGKIGRPFLIGAAFEFKQVDGFLIGKLMNAREEAFWQTARIHR